MSAPKKIISSSGLGYISGSNVGDVEYHAVRYVVNENSRQYAIIDKESAWINAPIIGGSTSEFYGTSTFHNPVVLSSGVNGDLNVSGDSTIYGHLYVDDSLIVKDDATMQSSLYVMGNNSLYVQGNTTLNKSLVVQEDAIFKSSIVVNGNLTLGGDISLEDINTKNIIAQYITSDNLLVKNNTTIGGSLNVQGITSSSIVSTNAITTNGIVSNNQSTINSGLSVNNASTFYSSLRVSGEATLGSTMVVNGDSTIGGSLNVQGITSSSIVSTNAITTNGIVSNNQSTINSGLSVNNDSTFYGSLRVSGEATLGSTMVVNGDSTIGGDLNVQGITSSSIVSTNAITTNGIVSNNQSTINSGLSVNNASTFYGSLRVSGEATLGSTMVVSGNSTIGGALNVHGITSSSIVSTNAITTNGIVSNGQSTINSGLSVNNSSTFYGTLRVSGTTALNNTLGVSGAATFSNDVSVSGNETIVGNLTVTGGTSLYSSLYVTGDVRFDGTNVDINGLNINKSTPGQMSMVLSGSGYTTASLFNDNNTKVIQIGSSTDLQEVRIGYGHNGQTVIRIGDIDDIIYLGGTTVTLMSTDVYVSDKKMYMNFSTTGTVMADAADSGIYIGEGINSEAAFIRVGPDTSHSWQIQGADGGGIVTLNTQLSGEIITTDRVGGLQTIRTALNVTGAATMTSTLNVSGGATLNSTVVVSGNTTIGGALNVQGITSSNIVSTNAITTNGIVSNNQSTINSNLSVNNASTFYGSLRVSGEATLGSTMVVSGNSTIDGALNVQGITSSSIVSNGQITTNGIVSNGLTTINSNLSVNNASTFYGSLRVSGEATLGSTMVINGNSTIGGALNVQGITSSNIVSKGESTFDSSLTIKGESFIPDGTLSINTSSSILPLFVNGTSAVKVPAGTTIQRPSEDHLGMFRFNTDNNLFEGYGNSGWTNVGSLSGISSQWLNTGSSDIYYNDGNVGINNGYPQKDLDVGGDIKYSGILINGSDDSNNELIPSNTAVSFRSSNATFLKTNVDYISQIDLTTLGSPAVGDTLWDLTDMYVSQTGNTYISGNFYNSSVNFLDSNNNINQLNGSSLFQLKNTLIKFSTNGTPLWIRKFVNNMNVESTLYFGGIDNNENVYIALFVDYQSDDYTTFSGYITDDNDQTISNSTYTKDIYSVKEVVFYKIDSSGAVSRLSKFLFYNANNTISAFSVDESGNFVAAGTCLGIITFISHTGSSSMIYNNPFGKQNGYIININTNGSVANSFYIEMTALMPYLSIQSIAINGNYIAAIGTITNSFDGSLNFYNNDGEIGKGITYDSTTFIVLYNKTTGIVQWVISMFDSFNYLNPYSVKIDNDGNVYFIGYFGGSPVFYKDQSVIFSRMNSEFNLLIKILNNGTYSWDSTISTTNAFSILNSLKITNTNIYFISFTDNTSPDDTIVNIQNSDLTSDTFSLTPSSSSILFSFSIDGVFDWSSLINNVKYSKQSIGIDSSNNLYIHSGRITSLSNTIVKNSNNESYSTTLSGIRIFTIKYSSTFNPSTYYLVNNLTSNDIGAIKKIILNDSFDAELIICDVYQPLGNIILQTPLQKYTALIWNNNSWNIYDETAPVSEWTKNGTSIYYNSGNVGIGTTTPVNKLDVVGTIKNDGIIMYGNETTEQALIPVNKSISYRSNIGSVDFASGPISLEWGSKIEHQAAEQYGVNNIATDSNSNIYTVAKYSPVYDPLPPMSYFVNIYNKDDTLYNKMTFASDLPVILLIKYNSSGVVQWVLKIESIDDIMMPLIISDSSDNIYAFGSFFGSTIDFYNSDGSLYGSLNKMSEYTGFLVKINSTGVFQWKTRFYTQSMPVELRTGTFDGSSSIYISGMFDSTGTSANLVSPGGVMPMDTFSQGSLNGTSIFNVYDQNTETYWEPASFVNTNKTEIYLNLYTPNLMGCVRIYFAPETSLLKRPNKVRITSPGILDTFDVDIPQTDQDYVDVVFSQVEVQELYLSFETTTVLPGDLPPRIYEIEFYLTKPVNGCMFESATGSSNIVLSGSASESLEMYLVKYNLNGVPQWATKVNCETDDDAGICVIANSSDVYVSVETNIVPENPSPLVIYNSNGTQFTSFLGSEKTATGILIKYNSNGTAQWFLRTDSGGFRYIQFHSTGIYLGHSYYNSGYFYDSSDNPVISLDNLESVEYFNLYKLNNNGQYIWRTFITRSEIQNMHVYLNDNILIAGKTFDLTGSNVYNTEGFFTTINGPVSVISYILSYDSSGQGEWVMKIIRMDSNPVINVFTDSNNNILLFGSSMFSAMPLDFEFYDNDESLVKSISNTNTNETTFIVKYELPRGPSEYFILNNLDSSYNGFVKSIVLTNTFAPATLKIVDSYPGGNVINTHQISKSIDLLWKDTNWLVKSSGNFDSEMTISNGNVGIGTTTPSYKLDVNGDINFTGSLYQNESLFKTSQWNDSSSDIYFNTGKVGLGTTSPIDKLQIENPATMRLVDTDAAIRILSSGSVNYIQTGAKPTGDYGTDYGTLRDLAFGGMFGGNEIMRLASTGNVGIGTASPNAPLQFAQSVGNRKIVLYENTNNDHQFYGLGVNAYIMRYQVPATNTHHVFYAATSGSASNELMRIQGDGTVGIGTASPSTSLHVVGTSTFAPSDISSSGVIIAPSNASYSNSALYINTTRAANSAFNLIDCRTNSTYQFLVRGDGNVGINASAPDEKIVVDGNSVIHANGKNFKGLMTSYASNVGGFPYYSSLVAKSLFVDPSTGTITSYGDGVNRFGSGIVYGHMYLDFVTFLSSGAGNTTTTLSNITRMRITNNGSVGIGTLSPAAKLELYDTTQASSRLILSGQEFYQASNTSTSGVSLLLGVNRLNNRQLWIADSNRLTQNSTNVAVRLYPDNIGGTGVLDAIATDGNTAKPLVINVGGGNVGIAKTNPSFKLDVNGSLNATTIFINNSQITTTMQASLWSATGSDVYRNSRIGVGFTTAPQAYIDMYGLSNEGFGNAAPICFQYSGGGYRNWILSRHMSDPNHNQNSIDFYLNNGSNSGDSIFNAGSGMNGGFSGTKHAMSVTAGGVGIGTTVPTAKLHISGNNSYPYYANVVSSNSIYDDNTLLLMNRTTATNNSGHNHGRISWTGYNRAVLSGYIECVSKGWDDAGGIVFGCSEGASGALERMRILENGNVGIGTASPGYKMEIASTGSPYQLGITNTTTNASYNLIEWKTGIYNSSSTRSNAVWQFGIQTVTNGASDSLDRIYIGRSGLSSGDLCVTRDGNVGINSLTTSGYRLYINGSIFASSGTITGSDSRIKQNIVTADTAVALEQINAIRLTRYDYRDKNLMANENTVYGVIAQEVQEVLPEAVKIMKAIIPNIMKTSKSYIVESIKYKEKPASSSSSTSDTNPTTNTDSNVSTVDETTNTPPEFESCTCVVEMDDPHGFTNGIIVKIVNDWTVDGVDNEIYIEIPVEVINDYSFRFTTTNKNFSELSSVFVYGNQVDDFHGVDKSKVFMPLIGAVQELSKKNTVLETKNAELETKVHSLETTLALVLERLAALEAK